MAIKVTPKKGDPNKITIRTKTKAEGKNQLYKWWLAETKDERARQLISTACFLKEQQQFRYRQAAIYARLYGNMPLFNFVGTNMYKMNMTNNLPTDRPTMNVIQSCIDTKVARITQSKPLPMFLTDGADYKDRSLAEQMNKFIVGELYRSKSYDLGEMLLTDAEVWGTGWWKVFENLDKKVAVERRLYTDILFDPNDARDGNPRMIYEFALVDRDVAAEMFPKYRSDIQKAEQAYPDNSEGSARTVSDQIMLVEAFRLPSSKTSGDGFHMIACDQGSIFEETYEKQCFPYVHLFSNPRQLGMDGQGAAERLMGTQTAINKLLMQMERSIDLITPVWLIEDGSKMVKAHFNNNLGRLQTYSGTPPVYQAPDPYNQELAQQLERLVSFAYQQEGVATMSAGGKMPEGLESGAAIRANDDIQSDRFAALERRYHQAFVDVSYLILDKAIDIAERDGSYDTVYPNKEGNKEINLPDIKKLKENVYIIQCMDTSSLPRDASGRIATITERMQAGIYTPQQGLSLMKSLDLVQEDQLMTAAEKRIRKVLDAIVEKGESGYEPPDPYTDLVTAKKLVVEYYNLYVAYNLEESKADLLRKWDTQLGMLQQAAQPAVPQMAPNGPQAVPQSRPVSPMLPNTPIASQIIG